MEESESDRERDMEWEWQRETGSERYKEVDKERDRKEKERVLFNSRWINYPCWLSLTCWYTTWPNFHCVCCFTVPRWWSCFFLQHIIGQPAWFVPPPNMCLHCYTVHVICDQRRLDRRPKRPYVITCQVAGFKYIFSIVHLDASSGKKVHSGHLTKQQGCTI